jgi:hypothetical protein
MSSLRAILFLLASALAWAAEPTSAAGRWYRGDGLGENIYLNLREDGTYEATWRGCLGEYGKASGRWSRTAGEVALTPRGEEGMMKGQFRTLVVIVEKEETKLIPKGDVGHPYSRVKTFRREETLRAERLARSLGRPTAPTPAP